MGAVDEPECFLTQTAAFLVGKLVAPLAGLLAHGFPINLF
jgi:hypothetical protein